MNGCESTQQGIEPLRRQRIRRVTKVRIKYHVFESKQTSMPL